MLPLRRRLHDDGAVSAAYLRLIPTEPTFVPSADHREGAVALVVAQLPNAREVTFRLTERVQLVDCGGNFEEVRCPKCGAPLEIEAWQDAMSQAYDGEGFGDLSYQTECCGHPTTLNDLDYTFAMGFARACLELGDPGTELPESLVAQLQPLLGCELRIIYAHC